MNTRPRAALHGLACLLTFSALGACTLDQGPPGEALGEDTEPLCAVSIDVTRSLFVTDPTALASFGFKTVMSRLITSSGAAAQTPLALYRQWWDTNNDSAHAQTTGPHCDESAPPGTVNGFAEQCPRQEGLLAATNPFSGSATTNPDFYVPTGLVNRFDLAPKDGANCGEYRVVYGKSSGVTSGVDRNLLIFEAKLPNPTPALGIEGCRPVAQFWSDLSQDADATSRATKLQSFYFDGLPGFEPVLRFDHYLGSELGSGQIRSNQFMTGRSYFNLGVLGQSWQLREYKLSQSCPTCSLVMGLSSVKVNPFGGLFSTSPGPLGPSFQTDFVDNQVALLAADKVNRVTMSTPGEFNGGESTEQGTSNDYTTQNGGNAAFQSAVQGKLTALGSTLTPKNITDRATTQSCAGCHQLSNNKALGGGLVWPSSNGFTQISETSALSPALTATFLPFRKRILQAFLCNTLSPADSASNTLGGAAIE